MDNKQKVDALLNLANKSQEQITDEYKVLSKEIADLTNKIKGLV